MVHHLRMSDAELRATLRYLQDQISAINFASLPDDPGVSGLLKWDEGTNTPKWIQLGSGLQFAGDFLVATGEGGGGGEETTPHMWNTADDIENNIFPDDYEWLWVAGRAEVADKGAAKFKKVASEPIHTGKRQSVDGAWWEIDERILRPEMFGEAPDDQSANAAPAINAAVSMHMRMNSTTLGKGTEVVWSGRYRIDEPIECFRLNGAGTEHDFVTVSIRGEKTGYGGNFGPGLYPTFKNRPALALQANRSSRFSDFTICGPTPLPVSSASTLILDDVAASNPWWNPNGDLVDQQFSMFCAMSYDPFSATDPLDGGYPGWTLGDGNDHYVGVRGSSNILVENVDVVNFIVGHMISPSNGTQLGDSIEIRGGRINNCKVAVAGGQDQNRHVTIYGVHSIGTRTFYDGLVYGRNLGVMPVIENCLIDFCKYILFCDGTRGPGYLINCFAESTWSIGAWRNANFPLTIQGLWLKGPYARDYVGCPDIDYHLYAGGPVHFIDGFLSKYANQPEAVVIVGDGDVTLDHTGLSGHVIGSYINGFGKIRYRGECTRRTVGVITEHLRDLDTVFAAGNQRESLSPNGGRFIENQGSTGAETRWIGRGEVKSILDTVVVTVNGDGTASFVAVDAGRYYVGQCLSASQTSHSVTLPNGSTATIQGGKFGRVASIVGTTINLDEVAQSLTTGTFTLTEPRIPYVKQRSVATTTNGSPTLSSVLNIDAWRDNDFIRGTGIPAGARILSRDTGAGTMTMSVNATASATVPIFDDCLQLEGEAAAAPTVGVWWAGDFLKAIAPALSGNSLGPIGYLCTASGEPGTWTAVYGTTARLTGSATYNPANLVDGDGATTTVTVTGAALGDYAEASFSLDLQGITLTAWVSAADTVSVRFQNETGGAIDLGSGTLRASVRKQ